MPAFDLLIPLLGLLLSLLAIGQLGLWAAQSISISSQNQAQYELVKQTLREQIRSNSQRSKSTIAKGNDTSTLTSAPVTNNAQAGFRRLQVVKTESEAEGCRSVYLRPIDGQPTEAFKAGQHLPIRFNIPGAPSPVTRCYSISNPSGDDFYRISVKAVAAPKECPEASPGLVSNYVNQHLKVGDVVEAKSPAGNFFLQATEAPVVMLAGGIGITPMVSMVEQMVKSGSKRLMVLVYGVRNRSEQPFRDRLDELASQHSNFVMVSCFSAPQPTDRQGLDYQVPGRVDLDLLKQLLPDPNCEFYLCGPPPFMDSLLNGLAQWGVPGERVLKESFGPASGHKLPNRRSVEVDSPAFAIAFAKSNNRATFAAGQTLLEAIEAAEVEVDSGCRAGSCESCLTRVLKGQVRYPGGENPEVGAGECLPCIAEPASDLELDL